MHSGWQLACAMWGMTGLATILVFLRLYTRIRIVKFVGAEDYMYTLTGIFLLSFTVFIQISVHYGLGQNFWQLSIPDSSDAIFWTYVANSFAIIGNAMAKLSMGLFLLRVVQVRWHKVALWGAVGITTTTSCVLTVMLWTQTTPTRLSWDPLRTVGRWNFQIQPLSVGLGVWSSLCDFFFAIFPWLFIWSLKMPRREKTMLASGMSLGVIAGACGITRTVVLSRLDVLNYTLNFVPYFAWAAAEIAVAMICIGIPTLRPLYLKTRGITTTANGSHNAELPQFMIIRKHTHTSQTHTPSPTIRPPTSTTTTPSNSHSPQFAERTSSLKSVHVPPGTPSTIHSNSNFGATIAKPASVYTASGSPRNSPRLNSSPRVIVVPPEPHRDIGVINVAREVRGEKEDLNWPLLNQF